MAYYFKKEDVLKLLENLRPKENSFEDIGDDDVDLHNKMWAANEVWYGFRDGIDNLRTIKMRKDNEI